MIEINSPLALSPSFVRHALTRQLCYPAVPILRLPRPFPRHCVVTVAVEPARNAPRHSYVPFPPTAASSIALLSCLSISTSR
ncbi:hypothetical protein B0H14DRAFT_3444493 [Mycena olivaceomarginata]|nr:hypothetical protein B0H14DRAFT_3444493 [Mycena olivaceomarginata]